MVKILVVLAVLTVLWAWQVRKMKTVRLRSLPVDRPRYGSRHDVGQ